MLRETLRSLAGLDLTGLDCRFFVVENNSELTVGPIVQELADTIGSDRVVATVEPRLGIAFARNHVLDAASGSDWLAFIDDDEVADPQWLVSLARSADRRGQHLVGGPVRLGAPPHGASRSELMVWRGLDARFRSVEARSRRLSTDGRDDRVAIGTGNWFADLAFVRQAGLRFDETLGLSGGEDMAFNRALRKAGGKSGWTPDAIIFESWPRERLSLGYQFRRARDQALAHHRTKYPSLTPVTVVVTAGIVLFKALGGVLRVLQAAFDRGASLTRAARAFGAAAGATGALFGRRSRHYETTSGR